MSKVRELRDQGYLYDGSAEEPELTAERTKAKDLCFEYNTQIRPSEWDRLSQVMDQILGKHGKNTAILQPFWCDYGYNIEIGDNFFANHNLVILDPGKVKIGNNVFFATNICITTAGHPIDTERRNSGIEYAYPVTIGDNVWVGTNVCILPGVTIGSNVVIGAGSVVNRDIPDNCVAVGNPCRVLRPITDADKEKYLVPPPCCQRK